MNNNECPTCGKPMSHSMTKRVTVLRSDERDQLRQRVRELEARCEWAEKRVMEMATLFHVTDGGQYLADCKTRAGVVDGLEKRIKELEACLAACLEKGKKWHPCDPVVVEANRLLKEAKR